MENEKTRFEILLRDPLRSELDAWRRKQPDIPNRAEAARRLIQLGLEKVFEDECSRLRAMTAKLTPLEEAIAASDKGGKHKREKA